MNCKDCTELLETYFDGELDPQISEAISLHLATCQLCRSELNDLTNELAVYRRYESGVEVPAELWKGIEAGLFTNEPRGLTAILRRLFATPRFSLPATAALVLVAVIVTIAIMNRATRRETETVAVDSGVIIESPVKVENESRVESTSPTPEKERPRVRKPVTAERSGVNKSPDQLVRDAEKKYLSAITILSRDVAQRKSRLDPETRIKLEQALSSIDRTIAATRRVVRQHPNDPVAAQYMLGAYARKVDALREMAAGGGL